jgi:hypothetical protein
VEVTGTLEKVMECVGMFFIFLDRLIGIKKLGFKFCFTCELVMTHTFMTHLLIKPNI